MKTDTDSPQQCVVIDFVAARLSRLSDRFVEDLGFTLNNKRTIDFACDVYHALQGLTASEYRFHKDDFFSGLGDIDDEMLHVIEQHSELFDLIDSNLSAI